MQRVDQRSGTSPGLERTLLITVVLASAFAFSCGPCSSEEAPTQTRARPVPAAGEPSREAPGLTAPAEGANLGEQRAESTLVVKAGGFDRGEEVDDYVSAADAEREVAREMGFEPWEPPPRLAEQLRRKFGNGILGSGYLAGIA